MPSLYAMFSELSLCNISDNRDAHDAHDVRHVCDQGTVEDIAVDDSVAGKQLQYLLLVDRNQLIVQA